MSTTTSSRSDQPVKMMVTLNSKNGFYGQTSLYDNPSGKEKKISDKVLEAATEMEQNHLIAEKLQLEIIMLRREIDLLKENYRLTEDYYQSEGANEILLAQLGLLPSEGLDLLTLTKQQKSNEISLLKSKSKNYNNQLENLKLALSKPELDKIRRTIDIEGKKKIDLMKQIKQVKAQIKAVKDRVKSLMNIDIYADIIRQRKVIEELHVNIHSEVSRHRSLKKVMSDIGEDNSFDEIRHLEDILNMQNDILDKKIKELEHLNQVHLEELRAFTMVQSPVTYTPPLLQSELGTTEVTDRSNELEELMNSRNKFNLAIALTNSVESKKGSKQATYIQRGLYNLTGFTRQILEHDDLLDEVSALTSQIERVIETERHKELLNIPVEHSSLNTSFNNNDIMNSSKVPPSKECVTRSDAVSKPGNLDQAPLGNYSSKRTGVDSVFVSDTNKSIRVPRISNDLNNSTAYNATTRGETSICTSSDDVSAYTPRESLYPTSDCVTPRNNHNAREEEAYRYCKHVDSSGNEDSVSASYRSKINEESNEIFQRIDNIQIPSVNSPVIQERTSSDHRTESHDRERCIYASEHSKSKKKKKLRKPSSVSIKESDIHELIPGKRNLNFSHNSKLDITIAPLLSAMNMIISQEAHMTGKHPSETVVESDRTSKTPKNSVSHGVDHHDTKNSVSVQTTDLQSLPESNRLENAESQKSSNIQPERLSNTAGESQNAGVVPSSAPNPSAHCQNFDVTPKASCQSTPTLNSSNVSHPDFSNRSDNGSARFGNNEKHEPGTSNLREVATEPVTPKFQFHYPSFEPSFVRWKQRSDFDPIIYKPIAQGSNFYFLPMEHHTIPSANMGSMFISNNSLHRSSQHLYERGHNSNTRSEESGAFTYDRLLTENHQQYFRSVTPNIDLKVSEGDSPVLRGDPSSLITEQQTQVNNTYYRHVAESQGVPLHQYVPSQVGGYKNVYPHYRVGSCPDQDNNTESCYFRTGHVVIPPRTNGISHEEYERMTRHNITISPSVHLCPCSPQKNITHLKFVGDSVIETENDESLRVNMSDGFYRLDEVPPLGLGDIKSRLGFSNKNISTQCSPSANNIPHAIGNTKIYKDEMFKAASVGTESSMLRDEMSIKKSSNQGSTLYNTPHFDEESSVNTRSKFFDASNSGYVQKTTFANEGESNARCSYNRDGEILEYSRGTSNKIADESSCELVNIYSTIVSKTEDTVKQASMIKEGCSTVESPLSYSKSPSISTISVSHSDLSKDNMCNSSSSIGTKNHHKAHSHNEERDIRLSDFDSSVLDNIVYESFNGSFEERKSEAGKLTSPQREDISHEDDASNSSHKSSKTNHSSVQKLNSLTSVSLKSSPSTGSSVAMNLTQLSITRTERVLSSPDHDTKVEPPSKPNFSPSDEPLTMNESSLKTDGFVWTESSVRDNVSIRSDTFISELSDMNQLPVNGKDSIKDNINTKSEPSTDKVEQYISKKSLRSNIILTPRRCHKGPETPPHTNPMNSFDESTFDYLHVTSSDSEKSFSKTGTFSKVSEESGIMNSYSISNAERGNSSKCVTNGTPKLISMLRTKLSGKTNRSKSVSAEGFASTSQIFSKKLYPESFRVQKRHASVDSVIPVKPLRTVEIVKEENSVRFDPEDIRNFFIESPRFDHENRKFIRDDGSLSFDKEYEHIYSKECTQIVRSVKSSLGKTKERAELDINNTAETDNFESPKVNSKGCEVVESLVISREVFAPEEYTDNCEIHSNYTKEESEEFEKSKLSSGVSQSTRSIIYSKAAKSSALNTTERVSRVPEVSKISMKSIQPLDINASDEISGKTSFVGIEESEEFEKSKFSKKSTISTEGDTSVKISNQLSFVGIEESEEFEWSKISSRFSYIKSDTPISANESSEHIPTRGGSDKLEASGSSQGKQSYVKCYKSLRSDDHSSLHHEEESDGFETFSHTSKPSDKSLSYAENCGREIFSSFNSSSSSSMINVSKHCNSGIEILNVRRKSSFGKKELEEREVSIFSSEPVNIAVSEGSNSPSANTIHIVDFHDADDSIIAIQESNVLSASMSFETEPKSFTGGFAVFYDNIPSSPKRSPKLEQTFSSIDPLQNMSNFSTSHDKEKTLNSLAN